MLAVATSAERCINIYSLPIRDQKLDGRFQQHGDMWDEVIHFHYFHCQYHFPEPVQKAPGNFPERSLHQVYRDPPVARHLCSHPVGLALQLRRYWSSAPGCTAGRASSVYPDKEMRHAGEDL